MKTRVQISKTSVKATTPVALGFRTHSGWAAAVTVAASRDGIEVVDRRRIELADPSIRGSFQPYHAAEGMELKAAQAFITRCIESTRDLAFRALKTLIDDQRHRNHTIGGCGILLASGKPLPGLASILASHALIHTAEGELYRDAIIRTANRFKIQVTAIKERELLEQAAAQFRLSVEALQRTINDTGRTIGSPWRQDQKYAAIAAWLALDTSEH
jgi:SHS2 domain-containing protein